MTRGITRPAGLIAAALLAAVLLVLPATAAATPSLTEVGGSSFPERSYALDLDEQRVLTTDDVTVRENGEPVSDLEVKTAAQATTGSFATVLVIDASNSMAGDPILQAMRAAQGFADARPAGQQLAVITFNKGNTTILPFTTDRADIRDALSAPPTLDSGTHVYDATKAAAALLQSANVDGGSIVVLSDGADTGSDATEADVSAAAAAAGARVFVVGLRSSAFDPSALQPLATGDDYADASRPQDLQAILSGFGAVLAREHLITYTSDAGAGQHVSVQVQVDGVPGFVTAEYKVPGSLTTQSKAEGFWSTTGAMVAAAAAIALLIGIGVVLFMRAERETPRERLARFVAVGREEEVRHVQRQGLLDSISESLDERPWWEGFKEELEIANIERPAIQIAALTAIGTALAMLLIGLVTYPILVLVAFVIPFVVRALVERRADHTRELFAEQLADNLQVVVSAVRAGQSFVGALTVVAAEASEPAKEEFQRVVNDERLGVPIEDALRDVARRMNSRDMEQVALVATIQREVGGNTAEVLERVIQTVRERADLRRLMDTLTAQGRLSRWIVSALPGVLLLAISILNPAYVKPLYTTTTGQILLGVAASLVITASLIIRRIVEVKV